MNTLTQGRRIGRTAAMLDLVSAPGCPPGTVMLVAPPSPSEAQLMRGMTVEERHLFQAFCGRIVVVKNVG